jgi:hypothetical protein
MPRYPGTSFNFGANVRKKLAAENRNGKKSPRKSGGGKRSNAWQSYIKGW